MPRGGDRASTCDIGETPVTTILEAGDPAPAFTLPDSNGAPVSLEAYRGRSVILYFFPQANTPACTTQACDLSDDLGSLELNGYDVLGISKDAVPALARFRQEQGIRFPLLADPGLEVHEAYGAWGEKNSYGRVVVGTKRSTFVINADGRIRFALYNVKATGHLQMLRRKLQLT
jgi:peroxiredoxin Q/BCP